MKDSLNSYKLSYPTHFDKHYEFVQFGDMNLTKKIKKNEAQ